MTIIKNVVWLEARRFDESEICKVFKINASDLVWLETRRFEAGEMPSIDPESG